VIRSFGVNQTKGRSYDRDWASSGRTTHVVDPLPVRVRLVGAPGELRGVELEVLDWSTDQWSGETAVICRLVDGSPGEIPARWTDLPWRVWAGADGWRGWVAGGLAVVAGAWSAALVALSAAACSVRGKRR
jgi:hypothetical protein